MARTFLEYASTTAPTNTERKTLPTFVKSIIQTWFGRFATTVRKAGLCGPRVGNGRDGRRRKATMLVREALKPSLARTPAMRLDPQRGHSRFMRFATSPIRSGSLLTDDFGRTSLSASVATS